MATINEVCQLLDMLLSVYPLYGRTPDMIANLKQAWATTLMDYSADELALATKLILRDPKQKDLPTPGMVIEKIEMLRGGTDAHDTDWAWRQCMSYAREALDARGENRRGMGYLDLRPKNMIPTFSQAIIECATSFGLESLFYCNPEDTTEYNITRSRFAKAWEAQGKRQEQRELLEAASPRMAETLNGLADRLSINAPREKR